VVPEVIVVLVFGCRSNADVGVVAEVMVVLVCGCRSNGGVGVWLQK
jgi:hypothetical protein